LLEQLSPQERDQLVREFGKTAPPGQQGGTEGAQNQGQTGEGRTGRSSSDGTSSKPDAPNSPSFPSDQEAGTSPKADSLNPGQSGSQPLPSLNGEAKRSTAAGKERSRRGPVQQARPFPGPSDETLQSAPLDLRDKNTDNMKVIAEWDRASDRSKDGAIAVQGAPAAGALSEGIRQAAAGAEHAIEQQEIPSQYSDLVRRVFNRYVQRAARPALPQQNEAPPPATVPQNSPAPASPSR